MSHFSGKVALVTGASRGIGRACALALAKEGADVVVNYRSHAEEAQEVQSLIEAMGRKALIYQADVARREAMEAMFAAVVAHFGRIDVAVANAGMSIREPFLTAKWENVLNVLEVAQFGVFHTCQLAAQQMVRQEQIGRSAGKIVVISSIFAELPAATSAAYNMAKAAVNHLVSTAAGELAPYHININVINPGWTDTPGERRYATEEEIREGGARLPWGRLATADEIAQAVLYLASDSADYVTGAMLRVDGGYVHGLTLPE
jgi:glucose 1-dehydrogenase